MLTSVPAIVAGCHTSCNIIVAVPSGNLDLTSAYLDVRSPAPNSQSGGCAMSCRDGRLCSFSQTWAAAWGGTRIILEGPINALLDRREPLISGIRSPPAEAYPAHQRQQPLHVVIVDRETREDLSQGYLGTCGEVLERNRDVG